VLGAKLVLKGWHRAKFGEKCFIKQSWEQKRYEHLKLVILALS
jgi:hypothetical protein